MFSIVSRIGMIAVGVIIMGSVGCATNRTVARIGTEEVTDLSGRWNDTDSKLVAEEMIRDVISRPWLARFSEEQGRIPVVIVGSVANESSEHIDTDIFIKDIERELINLGQVSVVASAEQRQEVRLEREDQQFEASEETRKRLSEETGSDFILQGRIGSIEDRIEGTKAVFYQIDLELINIESGVKAWIGTKEIKKLIEQSGTRL